MTLKDGLFIAGIVALFLLRLWMHRTETGKGPSLEC